MNRNASNDLATLLLSYYTDINLLKLGVSRSSVQFLGQNTHCQLCQIVKIQPFPDDQDMGLLDLVLWPLLQDCVSSQSYESLS